MMNQKPDSISAKPSGVDNQIQQEVGRNQGQAIGQMNGQTYFVSGDLHQNEKVTYPNILSREVSQQKKPIPSLLPYLVNRKKQKEELENTIETHLKEQSNSILVCIIHGDEYQCHSMFLKRLKKVLLPLMLKLDTTQVVIKDYDLPCPSEATKKFSESLLKNLANAVEGYSFASKEKINQTFCEYRYPIIVHTLLLTQDWESKGAKSLYKLLEFWNNWPEVASNQKLIVCISIKYQFKQYKSRGFLWLLKIVLDFLRTKKKLKILPKYYRYCKLNQKIRQQLQEISQSEFSQFEKLNGVVLPELSGIVRKDVEEWVLAKETKAVIGEIMDVQLIMKFVREIFEQCEDNTMSMENLAEQLIKLLKASNI